MIWVEAWKCVSVGLKAVEEINVTSLMAPTVPSTYSADSAQVHIDRSMKFAFLKTQF